MHAYIHSAILLRTVFRSYDHVKTDSVTKSENNYFPLKLWITIFLAVFTLQLKRVNLFANLNPSRINYTWFA